MSKWKPNAAFVLSVAIVVAVVALDVRRPDRAHAQEQSQPKAQKRTVDQHCKVVADVLPLNLQDELVKLNAQGITVDAQNDLRIVDNKFTIVVCDAADSEGDEGH